MRRLVLVLLASLLVLAQLSAHASGLKITATGSSLGLPRTAAAEAATAPLRASVAQMPRPSPLISADNAEPSAEEARSVPCSGLSLKSPARQNTASIDAQNVELVGQIGGPTQAVAVQGNYAYVGVGLRLVVLDVSDPVTPTEVGNTTPFPYFVEDVVVSGTLAYVAAGGAGLRVVDISDPANPVELGAWDSPGYAEGVAVAGSTVYLADGPYGLRVLDVSNPAGPTPVSSAYDMNYAFEVAVTGNQAYIAAAGAGLLVADVSDPAHPVEVSTLDISGYAYGIAVSGTLAYVADAWEGLRLVNVSDPAHPVVMGTCDTPGWALNVAVAGSTAHVADGAFGLRIVDVSDPAHPSEVGAYEVDGLARRVAVVDGMVYVADQRKGLRTLDVTDPSDPLQVSLYSQMMRARRVAVAGRYAYVAAEFQGLRVIDVSDPAHPREIAIYDTEGQTADVVVNGRYAYVATMPVSMDISYGLHVLDISDPAHPTRVGAIRWSNGEEYKGLALVDDTLYVVCGWGLQLIDVSDPLAPAKLGFIELVESSMNVTVSGTLAYVADDGGGVKIVDVSNPYSPTLVSTYDYPGANDMAIAGNTLYMAGSTTGLRVLDISDLRNPSEIGFYDTPGVADGVTFSGTEAYVSDGGGGMVVVDVSNPFTPTLSAAYDTAGYASHTTLVGNYAYVADSQGGLVILGKTVGSTAAKPEVRPLDTNTERRVSDFVPPPESDAAVFPLDRRNTNVTATLTRSPFRTPALGSSATRVVTSSLDSGPGTLRQILLDAIAGDTITFDPTVFPPAKPITISLASELPRVTQGHLTIDASNAGVILDGSNTPPGTTGLRLVSDGNAVKGLQILYFPTTGITIGNASYNRIGGDRTKGKGPLGEGNLLSGNAWDGMGIGGMEVPSIGNAVSGNLIGTDLSGTVALGNNSNGVTLAGWASYNVIGGATAGERNIISGNANGLMLFYNGVNGNVILGNYIGTDISGARPLGNSEYGVFIVDGPDGNIVGGTGPGEGNLISGNQTGVIIAGSDANHNAVIGNLIGTDASGTSALGNQTGISLYTGTFSRIEGNLISGNLGSGIALGDQNSLILGNLIGTDISGTRALGNGIGIGLMSGQHILVGGTTALERNTIADNHVGIDAAAAGTDYNWIAGNAIGTDATGTLPLGNLQMGLRMRDYAAHNFIQGNTIAFNRGEWWVVGGVYVEHSPYNAIRRNSIYGNIGAGIVLDQDGNQMLPAPVILTATETVVSGTACPGCTVEVFSDDEDEGRVYEGSTVANAAGVFTLTKGSALTGPYVTATATDGEGNTSEFSAPYTISVPPGTVALSGPASGITGASCAFSASVTPSSASTPITYVWEATGQTPVTHTAGLSDTVAFTWTSPGAKTIIVTASNVAGTVTNTHLITISPSFAPPTRWIANYGVSAGGWSTQDKYPRHVADVNGDGRADVVGFGGSGVYVSLSTGTSFGASTRWIAKFGYSATAGGWTSQNLYPRMLADVNKDGKADVVGFFSDGVYVSLSTGTGFGTPTRWIAKFGTSAAAGGWSSQDKYPRTLDDVNGDGRADIVGFFNDGVYVSRSTGTSFASPTRWIAGYGYSAGGWTSQDKYPRFVADVNGDGRADVVGFGNAGAYVSLSTGTGFGASTRWIAAFGYSAGGWTSQNLYPRTLADVNADSRADIIGFGKGGAYVSLSTGTSFAAPVLGIASYGTSAGGWSSFNTYPRAVADVNHDHKADIVGFAGSGVYVSLCQ